MTPWLAIAGTSVLGALAFFFAGFTLRIKPTGEGFTPARASVPAPVAHETDVRGMLQSLLRATQSSGAAVLDHDGLVVGHAGLRCEVSEALVGSLGAGLRGASGTVRRDAVVASTTPDGDAVRLRYATVDSGPCAGLYVVATLGSRADAAPGIEDRIFAAIPKMHLA